LCKHYFRLFYDFFRWVFGGLDTLRRVLIVYLRAAWRLRWGCVQSIQFSIYEPYKGSKDDFPLIAQVSFKGVNILLIIALKGVSRGVLYPDPFLIVMFGYHL